MFNTSLQTLSSEDNLRWYCNQRDTLADSNAKLWTVVGEFTSELCVAQQLIPAATTDCARWLNGRGNGARYDNSWVGEPKIKPQGNCKERTGDPKTWPAAYTKHLARSFETQTWVYEQAVSRGGALTLVGVDLLDVEDRGGRRLELPGRVDERVDPHSYHCQAAWVAVSLLVLVFWPLGLGVGAVSCCCGVHPGGHLAVDPDWTRILRRIMLDRE